MKLKLLVVLLLVILVGCSKKEQSAPAFTPPAEAKEVIQEVQIAGEAKRHYLAYEHSMLIETEENKVAAIYKTAQATCREAASELCTVLESQISTGKYVAASLKFRAKASGIRLLIAALSQQAEVTNQSTTAEDLAGPIEDGTKKLAMLHDYRSKLEALRGRASGDIDALIKVNHELAQVQSELEAKAGEQAHLMQRVDTETLRVSIGSQQNLSFWHPISTAFDNFGGNLAQGASTAITGIAFLIPWGLLLLVFVWAGRKLWRRWKRVDIKA
jgi:hypothetical protein